MAYDDETVELDVDLVVATSDDAVKLLFTDAGEEVWIPRSQILDPPKGHGLGEGDEPESVEIAAWLARDECLT